ncbi:MAG: hypothetical protein LBV75_03840 [Paludibacter sp.]|jgi:hypothetical protein|nr:hypothetical protein [Paludibacter sp.]
MKISELTPGDTFKFKGGNDKLKYIGSLSFEGITYYNYCYAENKSGSGYYTRNEHNLSVIKK